MDLSLQSGAPDLRGPRLHALIHLADMHQAAPVFQACSRRWGYSSEPDSPQFPSLCWCHTLMGETGAPEYTSVPSGGWCLGGKQQCEGRGEGAVREGLVREGLTKKRVFE